MIAAKNNVELSQIDDPSDLESQVILTPSKLKDSNDYYIDIRDIDIRPAEEQKLVRCNSA